MKCKTANLHLLCFCITSRCFCPGNLESHSNNKTICHRAVSQTFRCVKVLESDSFYRQHSRWPPLRNVKDENLPSPESYVSFCQPICACAHRGGDRDRRMRSESLCRRILILHLSRLTVDTSQHNVDNGTVALRWTLYLIRSDLTTKC